MSQLTSVLPGRAVLRVGGAERAKFLDGLVSCATDDLAPGALTYGALLTPQGKIITDMMIFAETDSLALDVPQAVRADLMRRLSLYKLRAAVTLEEADTCVAVTFAEDGAPADPRAGNLGGRRLVAPADAAEDAEVLARYTAARIAAGVPDAQIDFALGDAFPHDANMDLTHGVDFKKGCFVGQEVVSRMRHRGTARRRTVIVDGSADLPPTGTEITHAGRPIGRLGTTLGARGLAVVRIDRTDGAGEADGVALSLRVPEGAPFALGAA